jgi:flavin reductase (DIM6/NTAB) family NADH-FMN oxidoreductase RutF
METESTHHGFGGVASSQAGYIHSMSEQASRSENQLATQAVEGITAAHDYALFVVTTAGGEQLAGCLAGFVTQCSLSPPRFLVCLSKQNHTYRVAERASVLALHLLGRDQIQLASLFGELSGDMADKFSRCDWRFSSAGVPVLRHCPAWVTGRILRHFSVGDHEAFLITVDQGGKGKVRPQLTLQKAPSFSPGHPANNAATPESLSTQTVVAGVER